MLFKIFKKKNSIMTITNILTKQMMRIINALLLKLMHCNLSDKYFWCCNYKNLERQ